ncbi:hypothetical protein HAX54_023783 [Datura stramonium]|uniref:Uncharacterized protein n=1 Tax=Datura stramonium TaxID=4076 RepID=A0ABS8UWW2_DATST|nr:hypothetical protein [Datura stramonium]
MNVFAFQVTAQQVTKETIVSPAQTNMDEEIFGWEMDEEILEETFASLFLRGEELEESVHLEVKSVFGDPSSESPLQRNEPPTSCRSQPLYLEKTCIGNAHRHPPDDLSIFIGDFRYAQSSVSVALRDSRAAIRWCR